MSESSKGWRKKEFTKSFESYNIDNHSHHFWYNSFKKQNKLSDSEKKNSNGKSLLY